MLCYVVFQCSGVPLSTVGLQGALSNTSVHPLFKYIRFIIQIAKLGRKPSSLEGKP